MEAGAELTGECTSASLGRPTQWINPPWALIPQVIRKLKDEKAEAVLLLPYWTAASWFSDLVSMIDDHWILDPKDVEKIGESTNPAIPEPLRNNKWRLIVAHVPERK